MYRCKKRLDAIADAFPHDDPQLIEADVDEYDFFLVEEPANA